MAFNKLRCSQCDAVAEVSKSFEMGRETVHLLKCSHILRGDVLDKTDPSKIVSIDGKSPYRFQVEGIHFGEDSGARCLFADEMGLGKTVQAAGLVRLHPELAPVFIITKSTLKTQWQKEMIRWCGMEFLCQIIDGSKDQFIPGLRGYILSFDVLRRFVGKIKPDMSLPIPERVKQMEESNPLIQLIKKLKIKTIIIDECQAIKNPEAERTQQLRELAKHVEHIIALSGTPIKNNATEYFSILNILKPELYPVYSHFVFQECDMYYDGYKAKSGGLKNPKAFMEKTKKFIIRRERKDVLPDLPTITRNFSFHELAKEVQKQYIATLEEFEDEYNSGSAGIAREGNILAFISKMRHLTGLSKVNPCIDHVMEFMGSTKRKLVIFVHHKDVGEILKIRLTSLFKELELPEPLMLTSDLSPDARAAVVDKFMVGESRLMIASTLASGEGLNLQNCSDCIMLERQWNPANEEQAEGRFIRIGQLADKVTATYFVAVGTVDEFFSEIVERKREIITSTLGGEAIKWDQSGLMKELCELLSINGASRWKV